eukprot:TRINITY_DN831_c0_g2_i1.p3 TRINITY_DN831_c0_g2~~TRINITY_DN831_c0_g2_i1.p3  ORF type:complete len:119 (+),score=31.18 TRINITY_DN831_c0_g2_i1:863-1219(+)
MHSSTCTKWCQKTLESYDTTSQKYVTATCRLYKKTKCNKVNCDKGTTFRRFFFDKKYCKQHGESECHRRCTKKYCAQWVDDSKTVCNRTELLACTAKKVSIPLKFLSLIHISEPTRPY